MNIDVEWTAEQRFVGSDKSKTGYLPQWSVTASKNLGPHHFEKTLTCNQIGTPPVFTCRALERRVTRELEQDIMFNRELAEEGMAETS